MGVLLQLPEVEGPDTVGTQGDKEQEHTQKEAVVADPVDDEGLLPRVGRAVLLVPEADEQVRAEAHTFPAHEHEEQVVRGHQGEHHEDEEVEIGEIAGKPLILVHIPG